MDPDLHSDLGFAKKFNLLQLIYSLSMAFSVQIIVYSAARYFLPYTQEETEPIGILLTDLHGLSFETIFQFLLMAVGCSVLGSLFATTLLFKKMLTLWRIIWMTGSIFLFGSGLAFLFDWFGRSLAAWLSFYISFGSFFILAVSALLLKTRLENKRYEKMLTAFHEKKAEEK